MKIKNIKDCIENGYIRAIQFIKKTFGKAWIGGKIALIIFVIVISALAGFYLGTGLGKVIDIILCVLIGVIIMFLSKILVRILLRIMKDIQGEFLSVIVTVTIIITLGINFALSFPIYIALALAFIIVAAESFLGVGIWLLVKYRNKRILPLFLIIISLTINTLGILEIKSLGEENEGLIKYISSVKKSQESYKKGNSSITTANLKEKGNYKVKTLFYGSGTDKRRSEYGERVDIKTKSVYAYPFLENYTGLKGRLRTKYWGFDDRSMPINGRVWYPQGEEKFPLVLIVHGNHKMQEYSDGGYEYLGKLLASQGFITVSVDENFLNASWLEDLGGENDGRAWILLKHLDAWKEFNSDKKNIFYNKVELENIALIGHSRGGEAVATASVLNKLKYYPQNASIKFDFNYNIKSIVAIAPTDGQYKPAGKPTEVKNVDYLLIQGANDGDVSEFIGSNQYNRVKFDDEKYHFKSSLYIYGANHGQFNTVWGDRDIAEPFGTYLNLKPLLNGEEQRNIAKVYISAFLKTTLKGEKEYMPLFRDYRAGGEILPKTLYVNRFQDSTFKLINNYEEDADLETMSLKGGIQSTERIYKWKEINLQFRGDSLRYNNAVYLKWITREGKYSIELPGDTISSWGINNSSKLVFSACDIYENKIKNNSFQVTDFSIKLIDNNNEETIIPLSNIGRLHPPVGVKLSKWDFHNEKVYGEEFEPVLQSFQIPMEEFVKNNKRFIPRELKSIEFIFNKSYSGNIVIDDIGIEV